VPDPKMTRNNSPIVKKAKREE